MRPNVSSTLVRSVQPSHGIVTDMITPTTAPAAARTARSSAGAPGPLGHRLGHHRDRPGELVHRPRPDLRHGQGEPDGLMKDVHVGGGVGVEHLPAGRADGGDRAQVRWLLLERLDHPDVHVVLQDQVFLGREVPEERARRHLGRRGDLLHGGGLVALLAEQPERVLPEGSTRPGLLPLAQAGTGGSGSYRGRGVPRSCRAACRRHTSKSMPVRRRFPPAASPAAAAAPPEEPLSSRRDGAAGR